LAGGTSGGVEAQVALLTAKMAELVGTLQALQEENAALRRQLEFAWHVSQHQLYAPSTLPPSQPSLPVEPPSRPAPVAGRRRVGDRTPDRPVPELPEDDDEVLHPPSPNPDGEPKRARRSIGPGLDAAAPAAASSSGGAPTHV
jgi:hypothetical protein